MKNYYKINEISKLYNLGLDSLRYYEKLGILNPKRGENNYRQYSGKDIYRLNIIKDMKNLGFSMSKIGKYLENRSIDNTLNMIEEEIDVIEEKIKELQEMQENMKLRKKALYEAKELSLNTYKVVSLPARKCVTLNSKEINKDNVDFLITKLSTEHEKNLFIIGNFNTGCVIDIEKQEYSKVIIIGDTLETYEYEIPAGEYLVMNYRGKMDYSFKYFKQMKEYLDKNSYNAIEAIELLIIDEHETANPEEFLTQIQIRIEKQ